jgi:hypothetical protein
MEKQIALAKKINKLDKNKARRAGKYEDDESSTSQISNKNGNNL